MEIEFIKKLYNMKKTKHLAQLLAFLCEAMMQLCVFSGVKNFWRHFWPAAWCEHVQLLK